MARPNKFGSPYDPNNKLPHPKKEEEQSQCTPRDEQPQLRGCGDPNCPGCNPHTVGKGLPSISADQQAANIVRAAAESSRTGQDPTRIAVNGPARATVQDGRITSIDYASRLSNMYTRPDWVSMIFDESSVVNPDIRAFAISATSVRPEPVAPQPQAKPTPPQSYLDARDEVKDWLISAPEQSFDDIVGNDEALAQLRGAIQAPVVHKELYEAYGMKMPKGALLKGPPGCGKTMFARAAACEMRRLYPSDDSEFICISAATIQSPYVGVTEGHIVSIFRYAREYKAFHGHPLLVFIDEAEVLFPDRTGRIRRVAHWEESNVAAFLAEMDGIQDSGAFVMLATNRPQVIDQAVLRDGRCDFKIEVKRPTQQAVEVILQRQFARAFISPSTTAEELVMAAVEGLFDPFKILVDYKTLMVNFAEKEITEGPHKHFLMEHIVSGAIAASIPERAKRHAFARDKFAGKAAGIRVEDVTKAVNDLYEENKGLEHEFAFQEFREQLFKDIEDKNV